MRHRFKIEHDDKDVPDVFLSVRMKRRGGKLKAVKEADDLIANKVKLSPAEKLIRLNETGMEQYEIDTPWSSGSIINPKEAS